MNSDGFISLSKSSIFKQLGINNPTIQGFKTFLQNKKEDLKTILIKKGIKNDEIDTKTKPEYCGAICLQQLIINKIKTYQKKRLDDTNETAKILKNRLQYFTSDNFIKHFLESMPTRDDDDSKNTAGKSSYTKYLNNLFNIKYDNWRDDKLSKIDNQTQCRKSLRLPPGQSIAELQAIGNTICYLCGRKIYSNTGISTMECEHILPIISALSHWWLVKEKTKKYDYSQHELDLLKLEYDWSHSCCNRVKSNKDFITYGVSKRNECKYILNQPMIQSVLNDIRDSNKHDCLTVNSSGKIDIKQNINVNKRVQPLIDEINKNVEQFDDLSQYYLLTKYKLLSALDDVDFMNLLINAEGNENNEIQFRPKIDYEKIREKRELAKQLEKEELLKKMELIKQQKNDRNRRYTEFFSRRTMGGRNQEGRNQEGRNSKQKIKGGMITINDSTDKIVDNILTDEDILDFPLYDYNEYIIDENSTEFIINNILTNVQYEPKLEELEAEFYKLFNPDMINEAENEKLIPKSKIVSIIKPRNTNTLHHSPINETRKKRSRNQIENTFENKSRSKSRSQTMKIQRISPIMNKTINNNKESSNNSKKSPIKEPKFNKENSIFSFIK